MVIVMVVVCVSMYVVLCLCRVWGAVHVDLRLCVCVSQECLRLCLCLRLCVRASVFVC